MDTKWTPGPWSVERHTGTGQYITSHDDWSVNGESGESICFEGRANDRADANADLIAAAPDLYEALYYAFCVMEAEGNDTDVIEKALLKARGETA